jgi:tRNA-2-methylthio-N6-dimethylallyladenosine synthase
MFDITELPRLPYLFADTMKGSLSPGERAPARDLPEDVDYYWQITPNHTSTFEAFVPIQNGCNKFCTFCAVPYTRGREVSRPMEEIVAEVEELVQRGVRSITLLGQNVNSYGAEGSGSGRTAPAFAELLDRLGRITPAGEHPHWIYYTSPHPKDMGEDVLEVMARHETIAKQIHLPLQSGNDEVLRRMNRGYTVEDYLRLVERIRSYLPQATLFTDVIVGFTGETQEQFRGTAEVMKEVAFDMAYIAMYSPRPGASSARWEDDIPQDEKRKRLHHLSEILRKGSLARNKRLVGKQIPALIEGLDRKQGFVSGRTEGLQVIRAKGSPELIGHQVLLEIKKAAPLSMEGNLAGLLA